MIPLRVLFWNVARTTPPLLVRSVVHEQKAEVVLLAEPSTDLATMSETLNSEPGPPYEVPILTPDRLQIFVRMPANRVQPLHDGGYMSIRHVMPVLGWDFIMAAVHLPSKLYLDSAEQALLSTRWMQQIVAAEERVGHRRTLVVGDLNMNPFELGVVGSEGLHAVSSLGVARRRSRLVAGEERHLFYNPMWSLLGDCSPGPPGTYYYGAATPVTFFWNTFDQVLLRPSLASGFAPGDVSVLTSAAGNSLLTSAGVPNSNISDHLPILTRLRLEDATYGEEESVG